VGTLVYLDYPPNYEFHHSAVRQSFAKVSSKGKDRGIALLVSSFCLQMYLQSIIDTGKPRGIIYKGRHITLDELLEQLIHEFDGKVDVTIVDGVG